MEEPDLARQKVGREWPKRSGSAGALFVQSMTDARDESGDVPGIVVRPTADPDRPSVFAFLAVFAVLLFVPAIRQLFDR